MLAFSLRLALCLQVAAALVLARHGAAALLALLLPVPLVLAKMAIARLLSPPRSTGWAEVRAVLFELAAFLALYDGLMPFERLWTAPDDPPRPGRPYVVLVSGYLCDRALWWWMAARLRRSGVDVATVALEPPLASIDRLAEQIHARLAALSPDTPVMVVGHSMGGLAARACLQRHGSGSVRRLVTLGSPHHGTTWARLAPGRNARQMEPGNGWLAGLGAPPVPLLAIWSPRDSIVVPPASAQLAGARMAAIDDRGHLSLVFSRRVLALLRLEMQSLEDLEE